MAAVPFTRLACKGTMELWLPAQQHLHMRLVQHKYRHTVALKVGIIWSHKKQTKTLHTDIIRKCACVHVRKPRRVTLKFKIQ